MSIDVFTTSKAPGAYITEHDKSQYGMPRSYPSPVCLMFGYAPQGNVNTPMYMNRIEDIEMQFGIPETSLEKYFYNAAVNVVKAGGTALMNRLPYDNAQCNRIKYVRYAVEKPIHRQYIYADGAESEAAYREIDDEGIDMLELMHGLDDHFNGYSRIRLASDTVESMSVEEYEDATLDNLVLEQDSIYIFDIKKQQLGKNPLLDDPSVEYLGIIPMIVTPTTALYVQEKIENNSENDKIFNLLSIPMTTTSDGTVVGIDPDGIITDAPWKDPTQETDEYIQKQLEGILRDFSQTLEFNHTGTFYDKKSLGDEAALEFPLIRYVSSEHVESNYINHIGVLVFEMVFNKATDKVDFIMRESFIGQLCDTDSAHPPIENVINTQSKYIRIIRNVRNSPYRDFFHISNQPMVIFGMRDVDVAKKINYRKTIEEPISYMLDAWYSDVDGTHIDLILDAGITTVAHHAWKKYNDLTTTIITEDGREELAFGPNKSFYFNPSFEEVFVPGTLQTDTSEISMTEMDYCSTAWHKITDMFTSFIANRRGDCLFIADGPRCLNLDRNVPLTQRYSNLKTSDIFNRYLRFFTPHSSSYGTRIWNWVLAADNATGQAMWLPPSVVAGNIYARAERRSYPWLAPAGYDRGRAYNCNAIALRTKPYDDETNTLYSHNWNFFTQNIDSGILLEGNKTMQVEHTALDRVNVRRLCNYLKRRIRDISNRYKYEPNTAGLRMQYAEQMRNLLTFVKNGGGISSYAVVCSDANNTPDTIDRNELHCLIAIRPVKAVEFIVVDLCVTKDAVSFNEQMRMLR